MEFCSCSSPKSRLHIISKPLPFIYLFILALPHGMRDLVPWPGMKPGPPALGVWSLNHWTTREVPREALFLPILLMIMEGVGHLKAVSRDENKEDFSLLYSTVWLPVSDALGSLQKLPGLSFMNLYKDWASSVSDSFLLRFRPFVDRVA